MISKTGVHAVRALIALGRIEDGSFAGAGQIAGEIGAPRNYLGKLLQGMIDQGLVESQKGLGGGFRLARPPQQIRLYDILEPIERLSHWSRCILGRTACSDEHACLIHYRWKRVRQAYLKMLESTTIADLLQSGELDWNLT
jgi:Rrf2 family protein